MYNQECSPAKFLFDSPPFKNNYLGSYKTRASTQGK